MQLIAKHNKIHQKMPLGKALISPIPNSQTNKPLSIPFIKQIQIKNHFIREFRIISKRIQCLSDMKTKKGIIIIAQG